MPSDDEKKCKMSVFVINNNANNQVIIPNLVFLRQVGFLCYLAENYLAE